MFCSVAFMKTNGQTVRRHWGAWPAASRGNIFTPALAVLSRVLENDESTGDEVGESCH